VVKYLVDLKLKKSKAEIDSLVLEWLSMPLKQELFIAQKHQLMSLHTSYGTRYHMIG
jgi:hypothetical protein